MNINKPKIAAIEGHWETNRGEGMPLYLFGIPDMEAEETKYAIGIPNLGSLILTHSMDGEVQGLKDFAPEDRPNSLVVFWSFRIMVGLGMLMLLMALAGLILRKTGRFYEAPLVAPVRLFHTGPSGFIALLAGWLLRKWAVSHGWSMGSCALVMHSHLYQLNRLDLL